MESLPSFPPTKDEDMMMENATESFSSSAASDLGWGDGGGLAGLFTDNNYGLLNAAKFALHELTWNGSEGPDENLTEEADIVTAYPSQYSIFAIVVLALIMTVMMIIIVVGNILVIIAIFTENNLTGSQNWFIASLAMADGLIGLVVMPFSLSYELMGYWMFGTIWCEIHAAMDVLLCTASIMNICLISLDRYWSITKAIAYLNARTPTRVAMMIVTVWILSGLISIPPLLGWKQDIDMGWFHQILDQRGNMSQMAYLEYLDSTGTMDLENFTTTLEGVVYPQCRVSDRELADLKATTAVREREMGSEIDVRKAGRPEGRTHFIAVSPSPSLSLTGSITVK